jgi:hypothetical protein
MRLYRATRREGQNGEDFRHVALFPSRRIPANIPYLVDNIWEYLRPESAPSRRFAAFASTTPEQAVASALIDPSEEPDIWEVELNRDDQVVFCDVPDARDHPDVKALPRIITRSLQQSLAFDRYALTERHARLFVPAAAREDLVEYFQVNEDAPDLERELRNASTFWKDGNHVRIRLFGDLIDQPAPDGAVEIFFAPASGYRLKRVL